MKKLSLVFISFMMITILSALVFVPSTGLYTPINGTPVPEATGDEAISGLIDIGFNVYYGAEVYSQLRICSNGYIILGNGTGPNPDNSLFAGTGYPILAPLWDDTLVNGSVQYLQTGTVFTIQFSDVRWGHTATNSFNYQVQLTESMISSIRFIYGPSTGTPLNASASIGINMPPSGVNHFWSITPGSPASASVVTENNQVSVWPGQGTIYSFVPGPIDPVIVTIGDGSQTARLPVDMYYQNSLFETIYLSSELGIGGGSSIIRGLIFYNNFQDNLPGQPVNIWLGETALSDLSAGWVSASPLTQVFTGNVDFPNGQNNIYIPFTNSFLQTGGNLIMLVERPMDAIYHNQSDVFLSQTVGTNRSRNAYSDAYDFDPYNPSPAYNTINGQFPKTSFDIMPINYLSAIQGTVNSGGVPLAGATVAVNETILSQTTNVAGEFRFPLIQPGTYNVTFSKPGYTSQTLTTTVIWNQPGVLTVELALIPISTLCGTVTCNGIPIEDVQIGFNYPPYLFYTNAAGFYSISGMPAGTYSVSFNNVNYYNEFHSVTILEGLTTILDVDMEHLPVITIYGTVTGSDAPNVGLAGAEVYLMGWEPYETVTDAQGHFSIPGALSAIPYSYQITKPGYHLLEGEFNVFFDDYNMGTMIMQEWAYAVTNVQAVENAGHTAVNLTWTPHSPGLVISADDTEHKRDNDRSFIGYKVWRLPDGQQNNGAAWVLLTPNPIVSPAFVDTGWEIVPTGDYIWAIKAVYTNNVLSNPTFSNELPHISNMGTIAGVVRATNNVPLEGVVVSNGLFMGYTDVNGAYSILAYAGTCSVTASKLWYHTVTQDNVVVTAGDTTIVNFTLAHVANEENHNPVIATALLGCCPNPFSLNTTVNYAVKGTTSVKVEIFNINGQKVKTLVDETKTDGNYSARWDGTDSKGSSISGGIYFYKMTAGKFSSTRKMILLK